MDGLSVAMEALLFPGGARAWFWLEGLVFAVLLLHLLRRVVVFQAPPSLAPDDGSPAPEPSGTDGLLVTFLRRLEAAAASEDGHLDLADLTRLPALPAAALLGKVKTLNLTLSSSEMPMPGLERLQVGMSVCGEGHAPLSLADKEL
jgi:hypothetical protein